jgi:hypothetical protein
LFHYSQEELRRVEQLGQMQTNLGQALGRLLATCAEFRSSDYAEHLTGPLHTHAERIEQLSAWVSGVAQDFVDADGGEQPFFVAPLQQTGALNLDDATPEEPPAGPIPRLTLGPVHSPADQSFFVAPLQHTTALSLDDATVHPTQPPISNARFKLFENQPRSMADLAVLVNERYLKDYQTDETQQAGPIGITQIGPNRYLVTLVGIEWDTDMETNRLRNAMVDQGTPFNSDYFNIVEKTIRANIPAGSELVLAAHSHGGIVAQNLAGDSFFNLNEWPMYNGWLDGDSDEYIVTDVITFGSPVSQWPNGTIEYHMYAVADDVVPKLGVVHPLDAGVMNDSGKFHSLPGAPEGMTAHSLKTYAYLLKRDNPLNELSFTIEEWGPTYTFAADYWHNDGAELAPFPQEEK